jgi:hypothetical protein
MGVVHFIEENGAKGVSPPPQKKIGYIIYGGENAFLAASTEGGVLALRNHATLQTIAQPCTQRNNHATLQHNNHATFNATITQPDNRTITQHCNARIMQPCNATTTQPCNATLTQPCDTTITQSHNLATQQ